MFGAIVVFAAFSTGAGGRQEDNLLHLSFVFLNVISAKAIKI